MDKIELTPKQEAFAVAMADPKCPDMTEAYRRAGYSTDGKLATVNRAAFALSENPKVVARIKQLRAEVAEPVLITAMEVLSDWVKIATADPAEITRTRRHCCRFCYGVDGKYQWRDEEEWSRAVADTLDYNTSHSHRKNFVERDIPDCEGGFGYTPTIGPRAECPRCDGDGELSIYIADVRDLSPAARKLYAGVKQTQHGIEVKMRDQDGALQSIAKYLGMFPERVRVGGDPDNPAPIKTASLTADLTQDQAQRIYQQMIAGK